MEQIEIPYSIGETVYIVLNESNFRVSVKVVKAEIILVKWDGKVTVPIPITIYKKDVIMSFLCTDMKSNCYICKYTEPNRAISISIVYQSNITDSYKCAVDIAKKEINTYFKEKTRVLEKEKYDEIKELEGKNQ